MTDRSIDRLAIWHLFNARAHVYKTILDWIICSSIAAAAAVTAFRAIFPPWPPIDRATKLLIPLFVAAFLFFFGCTWTLYYIEMNTNQTANLIGMEPME